VRGLVPVPEADFARLLRIDVPENGRTLYRAGELYRVPVYGLAGSVSAAVRKAPPLPRRRTLTAVAQGSRGDTPLRAHSTRPRTGLTGPGVADVGK
jgi:hypothetical protein